MFPFKSATFYSTGHGLKEFIESSIVTSIFGFILQTKSSVIRAVHSDIKNTITCSYELYIQIIYLLLFAAYEIESIYQILAESNHDLSKKYMVTDVQ